MRSAEYLSKIRMSAGLKRAVLQKISIEGTEVTFHLLTDLTYSKEDVLYAEETSRDFVPKGCSARVSVMKSVPTAEGVRAAISQLLKTGFPAAAAFISPSDVEVIPGSEGGRFFLSLADRERAMFAQGDVLNALSEALMRKFCGAWYGDYRTVEREEGEIVHDAPPPAELVYAPRSFEIVGYSSIDGGSPKSAVYIADLSGEMPNVCLCGKILRIEERMTKKEKPFFRISLDDGSAKITLSYFSKKKSVERVRGLKEGDAVCLTGKYELYNGGFTFTAKTIDFGAPPEDFVPKSRPSRPVPAEYVAVKPETIEDLVQGTLFEGATVPEQYRKERFVVFDLETTGLNSSPVGGSMDRIIEIGAVKIENGQICERFSSFVACPVKLSAEIVKITGITDDMLLGAPDVKDVIADFYKFADGCSLVAHNIAFDSGFIRYYGEKEGYLFSHKKYDTLALAQRLLILPNYKLNTIADEMGFTFRHHRAFDDAFVTAKIFLQLLRMS